MSAYTIGEIVVWLLLAALLGFILGWVLRTLRCRSEHGRLDDDTQSRPAQVGAVDEPTFQSPTADEELSTTPAATTAHGFADTAESTPAESTPAESTPAESTPADSEGDQDGVAPDDESVEAEVDSDSSDFTPGKHANSAQPLEGGAAPGPEWVVKGNEDSMIYHTPQSRSYKATKAETWFRTQEDALAAGFRGPKRGRGAAAKPAALAAGDFEPGKHPNSAKPLEGGAAPGPEWVIKGNEDSMIYHAPDSRSYGATIAETWFRSEDDATAAGFRKPKR